MDQADQLNLKPGQKLCTNCWTNSLHQAKIPFPPEAGSSKTSDNTLEYEAEYSFHQQSLESVNEEMEGISPLKKVTL